MNPFDAVGTARISGAIYDRMCRLSMSYQDAADEIAIVERSIASGLAARRLDGEWTSKMVELVRRTREHPDLRIGSSVRGAIDAAMVTLSLAEVRGLPVDDPGVGLDAAIIALSGRVRLREGTTRTSEEIVTELWHEIFGRQADAGEGDGGKVTAPAGAHHPG